MQATFTPGKYTMQLSAKAYETWKFKEQGLPHDLVARCDDGVTVTAFSTRTGRHSCQRAGHYVLSWLWAVLAGVKQTQVAVRARGRGLEPWSRGNRDIDAADGSSCELMANMRQDHATACA